MSSEIPEVKTIYLFLVAMLTLVSCGDPNVPLTQPPRDAFRVSSPRPPRNLNARPSPSPPPTPQRGPSLGAITARFFDLPWPVATPAPPPGLLQISARFLKIPLPTPRPTPPTLDLDQLAISDQSRALLQELQSLMAQPGNDNLQPRIEALLEQLQQELAPEQLQQLMEQLLPAASLLDQDQLPPGVDPSLLESAPDLLENRLKPSPTPDPGQNSPDFN